MKLLLILITSILQDPVFIFCRDGFENSKVPKRMVFLQIFFLQGASNCILLEIVFKSF